MKLKNLMEKHLTGRHFGPPIDMQIRTMLIDTARLMKTDDEKVLLEKMEADDFPDNLPPPETEMDMEAEGMLKNKKENNPFDFELLREAALCVLRDQPVITEKEAYEK